MSINSLELLVKADRGIAARHFMDLVSSTRRCGVFSQGVGRAAACKELTSGTLQRLGGLTRVAFSLYPVICVQSG